MRKIRIYFVAMMIGLLAMPALAERRMWTLEDGTTLEAEYVAWVGGNITLKSARGKHSKIPFADLSEEDRVYIELMNPPTFNIEFINTGKQIPSPAESPHVPLHFPHKITDYVFGVDIRKQSLKPFSRELKIEYFAIGSETDGDNYVLLARNSASFTPNDENEGRFSFSGKPVRLERKSIYPNSPFRGITYKGYMVVISDENGNVIQHKESSAFLFDIVDTLREFPVSRRFNREGERTWPPRPTYADRNPWVWR